MSCNYNWEDQYDTDDIDDQCDGHHECVLSKYHGQEHECACGETQLEDIDEKQTDYRE